MNAQQIFTLCEQFGITAEIEITDLLGTRLAAHVETIGTGIDSYSFWTLVSTEIDLLPPRQWLEVMMPTIRKYERITHARLMLAGKEAK